MLTKLEDLKRLGMFAAVAESGSFTGGAATLGLTKAAVSRQVAVLEARLGVQLLQRTTRQMSLTEAGRVVLSHARRIVAEGEAVENLVEQQRTVPRGHVRVTAALGLGQRFVAPALADYLDRNPEVTAELSLDDHPVDIVKHGIDVAVRAGRLPDSELKQRKLAPLSLVVCASPSYVARHGEPTSPAALAEHRWVTFTPMGAPPRLRFERRGDVQRVRPTGRLAVNDGQALRDWLVRGVGISLLPRFWIERDLDEGRLRPLLRGWSMPRAAVYALHAHGTQPPRRVVGLLQHLAEQAAAFGLR
ncbi:MAG: LysR family transcriptional regulator [Myxococcota bacterium]